jgi:quinoprotein relay system zinc metallohydrolase 1
MSSVVRLLAIAWLFAAWHLAWAQADFKTLNYRLQARELAPSVYVVEGANADFSTSNGCNIINTGFIVTTAGVVVINTGPSKLYGEQLRALIQRTTSQPIAQVLQLNQHPDYFLGHQAFADVPRRATAATREGVAREAAAYETNLYRLCGDWMKGTETLAPNAALTPGLLRVGDREFELAELSGHTASDMVLIDKTSGVAFVGGLVFAQRVPTTPHAQVKDWQNSLARLAQQSLRTVVPSHGPVHQGKLGLEQTQRYLQWLDQQFNTWAREGLDMNEVLRASVPAEFRAWAAFETEYVRNVAHLYPGYEKRALGARR